MPNTREKLIELIRKADKEDYESRTQDEHYGFMADRLTESGVVIPVRCKNCKCSTLPAVLTQKYGNPGTLTCHNWKSPCNKRNVRSDGFCPYGERKEKE